MGVPGPQGANLGAPGMGAAPPPQTQNILANLTPQQREQFQQLINSTPEQVRPQRQQDARVYPVLHVCFLTLHIPCLTRTHVGGGTRLRSACAP